MVKRLAFFLLAPTIASLPATLFAQNSSDELADYISQAPTIYSKGVAYTTGVIAFTTSPGAAPNSTSKITVIGYRWGFTSNTLPIGTVVQLCDTDGGTVCLDISSSQQGTTYFFEGASAYTAHFSITFKVPGSGYQNPVLYPSNQDQLIVNYNY